MPFTLNGLHAYDQLCYELLHESMDHLIDLGARCNAHSDVLEADEADDEDDQPSPIKVLKAQLHLDGAEDEVKEVQHLIQILSQLLITRHTRYVVHHDPLPHSDEPDVACVVTGPSEPESRSGVDARA
jgi:hypothetical protein